VSVLIPFSGLAEMISLTHLSCVAGLDFQTVAFQLTVQGLAVNFQQLGGLALVLVYQLENLLDMIALDSPERGGRKRSVLVARNACSR